MNPVPSSKNSSSPRGILEVSNFDSKFKTYNRVYEPLEVVRCKKCEKVIAEAEELIRERDIPVNLYKVKGIA